MKKIITYILLATLCLVVAPQVEAQTRSTQASAQQKQREKDKAKREKERQKQQAERQKQQQKAQAERLKQQQKAQAEREKAAQDREKAQAEVAKEQERKAAEEEKKYAPVKQSDAVHLFNLGARLGYAAMFDNLGAYGKSYAESDTYNFMNKSLTGGAGAGLQFSYELEYHAFRFETGLTFDWLNSRSDYAFAMQRTLTTYPQTYTYYTDDLREVRNLGFLSIPMMFGAQFNRYYFMLGARVGYGLFGTYKQNGLYDVVVEDKDFLKDYGMGTHQLPAPQNNKLTLRQPDLRLAAEFGIDLDEWLQADPPKNAKKPKAGERYPFGKHYIHYKVALFAEYGVLNSNKTSGAQPLAFETTNWQPTATNTVLALGDGAKLNNLFVGAKFVMQFEVPSKRPTTPPARPSTININVVDDATGVHISDHVTYNFIRQGKQPATRESKSGKISRNVGNGNWTIQVTALDYDTITEYVVIEQPGTQKDLEMRLHKVPYFRFRVTDSETGKPLAANARIIRKGTDNSDNNINTDSITGAGKAKLNKNGRYTLHVDLMGYETYQTEVASIDDSINIALKPIKKGEVFVMKNLFFATNKTRILKTSEQSLEDLANYLERNPEINIKIIGHTDNVGSDAANQKLSEGRADAVREDLIKRGIDASRIEAEGRGETEPIDTNDTEEGRQNNRRVEIEIL